MTIKIKRSELRNWSGAFATDEDFAEHVRNYAAAVAEYNVHLKGVEADAKNEDLKPEERRVAFPPPDHHPLVKAAAEEGYEIVGPSLDEKKAALFAEVRRMESEALQSIIPPAKARHWAFHEADIRAKRHAAMVRTAEGQGQTFTIIVGDGDDLFMQDMEARRARQVVASRYAAKLEHDIDDLTDETVDSFAIAPFDA